MAPAGTTELYAPQIGAEYWSKRKMSDPAPERDIGELFDDDELIARALAEGVRDALRQHKAAGNPIAAWRDGRVVWIPPEEIDPDAVYLPDPEDET
jgi:hypothetical protein